jgi:putative ABC transport system permease protein
MSVLKLAWKNIVSNPLNLILSIILFGLGIGLISFLMLLNTQLSENFEKNLADIDLVIGAKGSPLQMILCSMYHIDNPTGNITVDEAKAFLNPGHPLLEISVPLSLGDSYKRHRIVGTNDGILELYNAQLDQGKIWAQDLDVTVGAGVARSTGLKIGDSFKSSHGFDDDADLAHDHSAFNVVGILKPSGSVVDQLILTNPSTVWAVHDHAAEDHAGHDHAHHTPPVRSNEELLQHPDKDITSLLIKYKDKTNYRTLSLPRAINEHTDMQAASPPYEINKLYSLIGVGTDAIRWLAILIAFVSAISIFISLYKSMKERKYELSLIRVMGGSRAILFMLIVIEGIILSFIGFVVGMIISHGGMEIMSKFLQASYRYDFTGWRVISGDAWLFVGSITLGIVAALIPAYQASYTDIHKALSEKN